MSNYYLQKPPSQTFKIVSSEAMRKTQPPALGTIGTTKQQPEILTDRPSMGDRLAKDIGQRNLREVYSMEKLGVEPNSQQIAARQGSTYIPSGVYSSGLRESSQQSVSFSLTQSNNSNGEQQLASGIKSIESTLRQQQPEQQQVYRGGITVTSSSRREPQEPAKPTRFLKPAATTTSAVPFSTAVPSLGALTYGATSSNIAALSSREGSREPSGLQSLTPPKYEPIQSAATERYLTDRKPATTANILNQAGNPEETNQQWKQSPNPPRVLYNQSRSPSAQGHSDQNSELNRLREENRVLSRELLNLRISAESGRDSSMELLKVENKQLREQTAVLKLTYEQKLAELQQRTANTKLEFEQFRGNSDTTMNMQRSELNQLVRENNRLKDFIDRLERERDQQQPKDVAALRRESNRWENSYQNLRLQQVALLEKNQKLIDQVKALKAAEDRFKAADRQRDVEVNSLQRDRIALEEQIHELHNQIERQKGEYQKATGRHADYERQLLNLKKEIQSLNRTIQQHESERNQLHSRINELKIERKNLLEQSKRATISADNSDIHQREAQSSLLAQLTEKVEEIGSLKKRISQMAAQISRRHDIEETTRLKDRIARLQLENDKLRKYNKNPSGQFDQVLKMQLTETQRFKDSLSSHMEIIHELREDLKAAKGQIEQLNREMQLQKLRLTVQRKNMNSHFAIEKEEFSSELQAVKKSLKTAQQKCKYWSNENRKKDEFMKMHLLGRTKSEEDRAFIRDFFRQYELHLQPQKTSIY